MATSERNYLAFRSESLAVIFALRKFRVYILSAIPFNLITDHQALFYAFKNNYVHGILCGWLDFLPKYEFEILYRPGAQNKSTDFLSRKPSDSKLMNYVIEGVLVCLSD